jgi:hypothetical protein
MVYYPTSKLPFHPALIQLTRSWKNHYRDIRTMKQEGEEDEHGIHEDNRGGHGALKDLL